MFVPIGFQVWPIFRPQIYIFAELFTILWFLPFHGPYFGPRAVSGIIFHSLRLNRKFLDTIEWLKCNIKCLFQLVFKFDQFLDLKFTYLLNYCRFCDFDPFIAILHLPASKYRTSAKSGKIWQNLIPMPNIGN